MSAVLEERYGRRTIAPGRRLVLLAAVVVVAVLTLGFIGWITVIKRPDVNYQDLGYQVSSPAQVQVVFDVSFSGRSRSHAPGRRPTAICTVHALNAEQTEVGLQDVRVTSGPQGRARATVTLPTSERAVSAEVKACKLA